MTSTHDLLLGARQARTALAGADTKTKNRALEAMADALLAHTEDILAANAQDMEDARGHISQVMLDRLALNESRIAVLRLSNCSW